MDSSNLAYVTGMVASAVAPCRIHNTSGKHETPIVWCEEFSVSRGGKSWFGTICIMTKINLMSGILAASCSRLQKPHWSNLNKKSTGAYTVTTCEPGLPAAVKMLDIVIFLYLKKNKDSNKKKKKYTKVGVLFFVCELIFTNTIVKKLRRCAECYSR